MAQVATKLIGGVGYLAPGSSGWMKWKLTYGGVWMFSAEVVGPQVSPGQVFNRKVEIVRVVFGREGVTPWAYINSKNVGAGGVYFKLYVAHIY